MQDMVEVANDNGTRMLDITVTSSSPREAADVANEYARVVSSYIAEIMATEEPSIVSVALEPTNPSNLGITATAVIGAVLGFIIALVIVCIQYFRDDMYKTADDIKKYTGLANLAVVPMSDTLTRKKNHRAKRAEK